MQAHGWDHKLKDPSYNTINIPKECQVVIVEGLYLGQTIEPWKTYVKPYIDSFILVECPFKEAAIRGIKRNLEACICKTLEDSQKRWEYNDEDNGMSFIGLISQQGVYIHIYHRYLRFTVP